MNELEQLKAEVAELKKWREERRVQQISYPIDESSRNALGAPSYVGPGSSDLTDTVNIGATPTSIQVPSAYAGTVIIRINGTSYEIPYL